MPKERKDRILTIEGNEYTAKDIVGMFLDQEKPIQEQQEAYQRVIKHLNHLLSTFDEPHEKRGTITKLAGSLHELPEAVLLQLRLIPPELQERIAITETDAAWKPTYRAWVSFDTAEGDYRVTMGYAGKFTSYNQMREIITGQAVDESEIKEALPVLVPGVDIPFQLEAFFTETWGIGSDRIGEVEKWFEGCQFHVEGIPRDFSIIHPDEPLRIPLRISSEASARAVNRVNLAVHSPFLDFTDL